MTRKLFWKLFASVTLGCMALVYLIAEISLHVERQMSLIEDVHKAQLIQYRDQADLLLQVGDYDALEVWLHALEQKENTVATIVRLDKQVVVNSASMEGNQVDIRLGRGVDWPIHLSHDNPKIELPLSAPGVSLVFLLPDHMMPGRQWPLIHMLLHLAVPLLLMMVVCVALYRHLMKPLQALDRATQKFSEGNYETRLLPSMRGRSDELGKLAATFDSMASKVGTLIQTQRHLINDLSHELRTPLQRIELCLASESTPVSSRLHKETYQMRRLVEDTLTLAWLQNESPCLRLEPVDLSALLEAIADDCRFEYPAQVLELRIPDECVIEDTSERALNLSLENVIRNALRHTPAGKIVSIQLSSNDDGINLQVADQGPGVPDNFLEMIFKPFFRVDKSRDRDAGGFGLGLALAKRQIEAMGGHIQANNSQQGGLTISICLPTSNEVQHRF